MEDATATTPTFDPGQLRTLSRRGERALAGLEAVRIKGPPGSTCVDQEIEVENARNDLWRHHRGMIEQAQIGRLDKVRVEAEALVHASRRWLRAWNQLGDCRRRVGQRPAKGDTVAAELTRLAAAWKAEADVAEKAAKAARAGKGG